VVRVWGAWVIAIWSWGEARGSAMRELVVCAYPYLARRKMVIKSRKVLIHYLDSSM
jgi:hypothetical protein